METYEFINICRSVNMEVTTKIFHEKHKCHSKQSGVWSAIYETCAQNEKTIDKLKYVLLDLRMGVHSENRPPPSLVDLFVHITNTL
jgi:hypothetical protein